MPEQPKDTSPLIRSRRIKRQVSIREENTPPIAMFDTTVEYPSDQLPEWFAPLQSIVEDEAFTSMVIYLGNGLTRYHITLKES
jgi:hypothetical protein